MVSSLTSHACQFVPSKASHNNGGSSGSTPTPSIVQLNCSRTAHRGTASVNPTISASPGSGGVLNAANGTRMRSWSVRASRIPSPETAGVSTEPNEQATIGRSSVVVNTTGSSVSVRSVAVRVPRGSVIVACAGDDR